MSTVILKPTASTITGVTNQGAPQISVREVQTTLTAKNGDTIRDWGLLKERGYRSDDEDPAARRPTNTAPPVPAQSGTISDAQICHYRHAARMLKSPLETEAPPANDPSEP